MTIEEGKVETATAWMYVHAAKGWHDDGDSRLREDVGCVSKDEEKFRHCEEGFCVAGTGKFGTERIGHRTTPADLKRKLAVAVLYLVTDGHGVYCQERDWYGACSGGP